MQGSCRGGESDQVATPAWRWLSICRVVRSSILYSQGRARSTHMASLSVCAVLVDTLDEERAAWVRDALERLSVAAALCEAPGSRIQLGRYVAQRSTRKKEVQRLVDRRGGQGVQTFYLGGTSSSTGTPMQRPLIYSLP
jgi:hypothetical protein